MTNEEISEFQRRDREWQKTPLGAAFSKMTNALGKAWVADIESGFRGNMSDKRLREIWDAERAATQEFRTLLDAQTRQHAELLAAAKEVIRGLNARIDAASTAKEPVPVFHGIADLASAIAKTEAR